MVQKGNQQPPQRHSQSSSQAQYKGGGKIETNSLLLSNDHWQRIELISKRAFLGKTLPDSIKTVEAAFIIALKGVSLGFDPQYAMEHINVINGKATIDGQGMLALIYRHGKIKVMFPRSEREHESSSVTMQRQGQEPVTIVWTLERASRAGLLVKENWRKYPGPMLRWRAVSECARLVAPDVLGGLYLHEEMGAIVDEEGNVVNVDPARIEKARPVEATPAAVEAPKSEVSSEVIALPSASELEDRITEADHASFVEFYHGFGWTGAQITEQIQSMFQRQRLSELFRYQLKALMAHVEQHARPKSPEEIAAEAIDQLK